MTTSETEEMLEKCYAVGCCGSVLLIDTPCDRCPWVEKFENKTKEENNEES